MLLKQTDIQQRKVYVCPASRNKALELTKTLVFKLHDYRWLKKIYDIGKQLQMATPDQKLSSQ